MFYDYEIEAICLAAQSVVNIW